MKKILYLLLLSLIFAFGVKAQVAPPTGKVYTNFATGGSVGTANNTVDKYSIININQTTSGQTISIPNPSPTATPQAKNLRIRNVGSASFTLSGFGLVLPGTGVQCDWTGSAYSFMGTGSAPTGSGSAGQVSYFNGTNSITSDGNFTYTSGNGVLGTSLTTPTVYGSSASGGDLSLMSTSSATKGAIFIGQKATYRNNTGTFSVNGIVSVPSTGVGIDLHNVSDTTTNYEKLKIYKSSNVFRYECLTAGTGTARSLLFSSSGKTFTINTTSSVTGHFNFNNSSVSTTNNASSLGLSGTSSNASNNHNDLSLIRTYNQSGTAGFTCLWISPFLQATGSGTKRLLSVGTNSAADGSGTHTEYVYIDNTGVFNLSTGSQLNLFNGVGIAPGTGTGTKIGLQTTAKIGFWNATPIVQPVNTTAINDVLVNTGFRASGGVSNFSTSVNLAAGTTAALTAPIKFTSGTNMTTPEAGAVEFDGTNFFATASTTRYTIAKTLTNTATLDFPSTAATAVSDLNVTVTGAALNDVVDIGVPNGSVTATASYTAWVSAANTVTVRFSPKATEDPLSGTFRVSITKY